MKRISLNSRSLIALAAGIAVLLLSPGLRLPAAQITWNGGGANSLWTTGSNWVGGTAPVSGVDTLAFDGSTRLANTNNFSTFSTANIVFATTAGAFTLSGSSVTVNGTIENLSLTQSQTLSLNIQTDTGIAFRTANNASASGDIAITGTISGAGGIDKQVTSGQIAALVLSGLNTYTGQTVLTAGTIKFDTIKNVGGGASSLGAPTTVANGTILFGNSGNAVQLMYTGAGSTTDRNVTLGGSSTSYTINQNGTGNLKFTGTFSSSPSVTTNRILTLTGSTAGTGEISGPIQNGTLSGTTVLTQVRKQGTGTWSLTGSNSYGGATQVQAGVLNIQNASALGSTDGSTNVLAGAALQIQNNITVTGEALTLNGSGVSSDGALRNVSGNNTYAGVITLASDARINSDAGTLTVNTGTVTGAGFTLQVGGAGNTAISSVIGTTTGGLTKDGSGTLSLQGANTFSGTSAINAGTLSLQNSGALGGGGNVTFGGGTLQYSGSNNVDYSSKIVSSGSAIRIDTNGQTVTFASAIASSNTGGLIKTGAGTLLLNAANQYTGQTLIQSGTLGGSGSVLGNVTINSGATLSPGNSPGIMNVGSLTLDAGSSTLMEITGTVPGTSYDQVNSAGAVIFGGTLSISMGYSGVNFGTDPAQSFMNGDKWSLFTSGTYTNFSGNFSSVILSGSYGNLVFTSGTSGAWIANVTPNTGFIFYTSGINAGVLFAVPEPGGLALAGLGVSLVGAMGLWRRRARLLSRPSG